MVGYIKEDESELITFTDLKEANMDNLKLPLGDIKPTFIAILCGDSENKNFIIKKIKHEIDSTDKNLKCEHQSQIYAAGTVYDTFVPIYHNIGFKVIVA